MLLLAVIQSHVVAMESFKGIVIEEISKINSVIGYDDGNMDTNGEAFIIEHFMPCSAVVFDVGANIGLWSKHVLKVNSNLKVYAFEPIPQIFSILVTNIDAKTYNFYPSQIGLSDNNVQKSFYIYSKNIETTGMSTCYRREEDIEKRIGLVPTEINIKTKTLDLFCEEQAISSIEFLKIDTEGSEFDVLKGASGMLQKNSISAIQFEYGGTYVSAHIKLHDVFFFLKGFGYRVFRILPDKLVHIAEWKAELENYRYANFLAISSRLFLEA